jgi:TRAP-type uncharacterized transport system substrate-binding protein
MKRTRVPLNRPAVLAAEGCGTRSEKIASIQRSGGVLLLLLTTVLCAGTPARSDRGQEKPQEIAIATGPPNQIYHAVGRGLAKLINEQLADGRLPPDQRLKAVAVVTTSAGENAKLVAKGEKHRICSVRRKTESKDQTYWTLDVNRTKREVGADPQPQEALSEPSPEVPLRLGIMSSLLTPPTDLAQKRNLRGIAVLWDEYLQLVVSPAISHKKVGRKSVGSIADLEGIARQRRLKIYLSPRGSNTYRVAAALLRQSRLTNYQDITGSPDRCPAVVTFEDAADALTTHNKKGQIDAAFFFSGIPNPAVEQVLSKGCKLLSTVDWKPKDQKPGLARPPALGQESYIPAQTYRGVAWAIPTFTGKALLVGSNALTKAQVSVILSAIFDAREGEAGLEDLVKEHEAAEQIRLLNTLDELRRPLRRRRWMSLRFHPGARAFWDGEAHRQVKIAAGSLEGMSFRLGLEIASALEDHDIRAGVVNTVDDRDSIALLRKKRVDLALLHNDLAAVGYAEKLPTEAKVGNALSQSIRRVTSYFYPQEAKNDLRLISFLYPEAVHVLAVRLPPSHLRQCIHREPQDFKELLELLIKQTKPWRFALLDEAFGEPQGDMPEDRDTQVVRHYARVLGEDGAIPKERLPRLSVAEAQNRLLTGYLVGAMVTSGVPSEAVQRLLSPQDPRFKRLANQPRWCPYCGRPLSEPLGVRVLPLRTPPTSSQASAKEPSQPGVPGSIQGLIENYRWFEPFTLPPETYPVAEVAPTSTVAVKEVLVCREDCPNVYGITSALVDDEVRLRMVVRGINFHNPLFRDKDNPHNEDPSIPVHAAALTYYQDHNILEKLPPQTGLWWEKAVAVAEPALGGLFIGTLLPLLFKWFSRWRAKRKTSLETELRNAYFHHLRDVHFLDGWTGGSKLIRLQAIWGKVLDAYEGRRLDPESADALDKLAREYHEYLRTNLADEPEGD